MIIQGRIKVSPSNRGIVKQILQTEGLGIDEEEDTLYIYEEKDPFIFNRTKVLKVLEKLKEIGIKDCEIEGYSKVTIFQYSLKEGDFVERFK